MEKIKVLYISSASSIHTIRWVNSLSQRSDLIIYLVSQHNLIDDLSENVIFSLLPFSGWFGYVFNIFKLREIILAWEPDLLHVNYASGYGLTANLLNFHPLVLSAWGSDIFDFPKKSFIHKKLLELNLNNADVILSTSNAMANEIRKFTKDNNLLVNPFGIDINQFKKKKTSTKEKYITIGTIKTLSEIYGIDILIKGFSLAYKKLLKSDLVLAKKMRLKIIGSGQQKRNLLDLISSLGISEISILKDRVKHNCVPLEMKEISIFCAFSRQESFGVAVLEASASGIPVITSDRGGLPEVVVDGATGIIIKELTPEFASRAIVNLVKDQNLRTSLGNNGREFVTNRYNWINSVERVVQIYKSLLIK